MMKKNAQKLPEDNQNLIEYYFSKTLSDDEKMLFKTHYATSAEFKKEVDETAKIIVVTKGLCLQEQQQREKYAEQQARNQARLRAVETAKRQAFADKRDKDKQAKSIAELVGARLPAAEKKLPRWLVPVVIATAVIAIVSLAITIFFAVYYSAFLRGN